MVPRVVLGSAVLPGGAELRLIGRGGEFSISLRNNELMNSRHGGSEEALAALACDRLADAPPTCVLIGGLGMGFTLRAALGRLPAACAVIVAELVPEVVAWARGPLAGLFGDSLADPRVRIVEGDVAVPIRTARSRFDAILLDVDNGPDGLSQPANDRLYDAAGLAAARAALRPGGVLAIWSSAPDAAFAARLRRGGFDVAEARVRANGTRGGAHHVIWIATAPRPPGPAG